MGTGESLELCDMRRIVLATLMLGMTVAPTSAQETFVSFLGGAAVALGAHEGGHVAFDLGFGVTPGIEKVSFGGIPFFAITHDPVSPAREFTISSAGFWVQHVSDEVILGRHPDLRHERAPFLKGMLAFNVLTSVGYAGAAFASVGPAQRDTRGIAASARVAEPWIGAAILTPAVLDAVRYYQPNAAWAAWASRAVKVGQVFLVVRAARN